MSTARQECREEAGDSGGNVRLRVVLRRSGEVQLPAKVNSEAGPVLLRHCPVHV